MEAITLAAAAIGMLLSAVLALLIVVAGPRHRHRHRHRHPAPGPERTSAAGEPTAARTRPVRADR